jgi:leader peptidase (prepilin peptidase)/N-methyltransferase
LMMMAGAFLGWQMIVVSFFAGTFVALFFAVPLLIFRRENMLPFGPGLAIGVVITMMSWPRIGPGLQLYFFDWVTMVLGATILGGGMFLSSLVLRRRV